MSRDSQRPRDTPSRLQSRADGFRWIVAVIDCVLGTGIGYISIFILFFRRGADIFTNVPDEFWGTLLGGYGVWMLWTGSRLITEPHQHRWVSVRRRHLITAALSGLVIALMWLSLIGDSHDGFGPAMGVLIYTVVFGGVFLFSLVVALSMPKLTQNEKNA